jgi:hypothetical protein
MYLIHRQIQSLLPTLPEGYIEQPLLQQSAFNPHQRVRYILFQQFALYEIIQSQFFSLNRSNLLKCASSPGQVE